MWVVPRQETAFYWSKNAVEDVSPVAEHIEDHPAAVFLAVVPRGALWGNGVALKNPIAELTPHSKNTAKKAHVAQPLELYQSREPEACPAPCRV